jgi:hypothetical protein
MGLAIVQAELRKHDFDCFVDRSAPLAPGHRGVVVPGCPYCKKTLYTNIQDRHSRLFFSSPPTHGLISPMTKEPTN